MQNDRNSLKAGIFMIASLALMIAIVGGIKGFGRFLQPTQTVQATFALTDNIGGLAKGDEVRIGGAKVGVIREVDLVDEPDGSKKIAINFTIPKRFVVHKDAKLTIDAPMVGETKLNFTSLGSGEPLAAGESLSGLPSSFNELLGAGSDVVAMVRDVRQTTLPKVNNAVDKTTETVAVYKETGQTATNFIKHLDSKIDPAADKYHAVADTAKGALQNFSDLFGDTKTDFRTAVANVKDATGTVKEKLPGMMDKADGALGKLSAALDEATAALQDIKKVAANMRDISASTRSIIVNNRGKIEAMIASLKATSENLKNGTAELRRNPWRIIHAPTQGEMANLALYDSARQFAEGAGQLNDASLALRDALKDPDVDPEQVRKLVEKLDKSFSSFNEVEQELWKQVKQ